MPNTHSRGGLDYGVRHLHASHEASLEELVGQALSAEPFDGQLPARELIGLGAVYVDGKRLQNPDALIRAGSLLRIHAQPRRYPLLSLRNRIVEQTPNFIIIDKPAGLPVHAMVDNARENILSYLEAELGLRCYITHRLDIETSGVLLIALNPAAQTSLNKLLQAKAIRRQYTAFVQAHVAPATYVHYMQDAPTAPKIIFNEAGDSRLRCELTVRSCRPCTREEIAKLWTIDSIEDSAFYTLSIELGTGRTQQIRAQLAHLGASIVGDTLYKNINCLLDRLTLKRAIALRAESLTFPDDRRSHSDRA